MFHVICLHLIVLLISGTFSFSLWCFPATLSVLQCRRVTMRSISVVGGLCFLLPWLQHNAPEWLLGLSRWAEPAMCVCVGASYFNSESEQARMLLRYRQIRGGSFGYSLVMWSDLSLAGKHHFETLPWWWDCQACRMRFRIQCISVPVFREQRLSWVSL